MYVFQGLVLISVLGTAASYRQHRRNGPLALALVSAVLVFAAYYLVFSQLLVYAGMMGLLLAAGLNHWTFTTMKQPPPLQLASQLTCPVCAHQQVETMAQNACQYFYECPRCHTILKPKAGDCCVFCSYGTVKCPPIQQGLACC